ncbi:MAG TPA: GDSL-type esterase/lipase family protein [Stellaceae bacterium]|nr:GDSL-type esterase/lipase family protein [Stellaceae bacterium]
MDLRIAFFGDSFVNGFGDPDSLGWVGRVSAAAIARGHVVTCYNGGIRRNTSADVRARWRDEALRRLPAEHPRALAFSFGVNDCLVENGQRRVEHAASVANARQILDDARTLAPTLMVGPPPIADADVNARVASLIPALQAVCQALSVPFLDVFGALKSSAAWMDEAAANDGAHPGRGGYQAFADLVDRWPPWRAWLP